MKQKKKLNKYLIKNNFQRINNNKYIKFIIRNNIK